MVALCWRWAYGHHGETGAAQAGSPAPDRAVLMLFTCARTKSLATGPPIAAMLPGSRRFGATALPVMSLSP